MNLKKGTNSLILERILDETYETLKNLTVLDYVLGLNYTAVKTESGVGLAYSFGGIHSSDCCVDISHLSGISCKEIADFIYKQDFLLNSILVATINSTLNNGVDDNKQLYEKFDFNNKVVAMVGDFKPLTKNIKDIAKRLDIYELKDIPGTIKPNFAKLFLREADYLVITGSTFVNFTVEDYIRNINENCTVIFAGPTTPLSNVLSEIGYIAGSTVKDAECCLDLVKKGAGMHSLKKYLTKKWINKSNH